MVEVGAVIYSVFISMFLFSICCIPICNGGMGISKSEEEEEQWLQQKSIEKETSRKMMKKMMRDDELNEIKVVELPEWNFDDE